ncbi:MULTISPECIES: DUF1707 and DUF4870 domain-containing protein [unclassified Nocardiopsis]|jgi:uncharacterized Tic20 family protein|uniref:DUF1707 and DUF4870 domain-containing protein n=1 Tax=unclassified Nocardiopsis TaxID=2649073 RepID=UPI0009E3077C|nr:MULTISPECIES: DUF1707 and DUF4870 domain-containing protein [unclassified Nocardiopsis]MBQ1083346.1 DUF1707 and DUF4870 domain-containing protein [Nocardiopsis sp. B62]
MAVQNPQKPPRRNPWDQSPAVPEPHIRLTHADRDAVAEVLREAYSQGQLDEDEFGDRLDHAMRAKVSADLVPLTADLGVRVSPGGTGNARGATGPQQGKGEKEPQLTTDNPVEKVGAAAGHLSAFFLPFLAPLVLLLIGGELSPYLRRQAMEALNFQLFCLVGAIASLLLVWLVLPALVLVGIFLGWFILPIIAAAGALMGRSWKYPLVYRLIKDN